MTETNSLSPWQAERNRSEFLKWLDILQRLVDSAPASWVVWQQTRDAQEILAELARRLGFAYGPIERRNETFITLGEKGRESHNREWVIATEPFGDSAAERYDGWIDYLDRPLSQGVRGGMQDPEFRLQVLARLGRWRAAVGRSD